MANRRMFSKNITQTDVFLDMPMSTQCLYFHLNMSADDDGFIGNTKTIRRMIGAGEDDLKLLLAKGFIIPFESGVVVIKDWKIHNYIQKDRYNPTIYKEEKKQLEENENKQYQLKSDVYTECIQNGYKTDTQVRLGKDRLDKLSKDNMSSSDEHDHVPCKEIIDYLNQKAKTHYKPTTKKTKDLVKARFNEGFTLDDFKTVIDKKSSDWLDSTKWSRYLRPETLFGTKFESYLNEPSNKNTGQGGLFYGSESSTDNERPF